MSQSSTQAINAMNASDAEHDYLNALCSLTSLALPLVKVPSGVPATTALRCELQSLHEAIYRVRVEAMRALFERAGVTDAIKPEDACRRFSP